MAKRIAVIGTGMWGTTLSRMLSQRELHVTLWARHPDEAMTLGRDRENNKALPGVRLPDSLVITASLEIALEGCELLLLVVPAQTMRDNLRQLSQHLQPSTIVLSATKGLEVGTCKRMSEVILEVLPASLAPRVAVLSGPNLAKEIAAGLPATTVVAARDQEVATLVQETLGTPSFRVYTNPDVVGVELGGALKNVIALGAGIGDGLGVGDNAKAAFLTRGLAEMARLGVAAGANPLTFAGLAGLGDLIATCASPHSRNRYVGQELARGRSLADIQASMRMVAEGVSTAAAARELAKRYGVEMPIAELVYEVLFLGKSPRQAVVELMSREPTRELHGIEAFISDTVRTIAET
ncbi:MAG: NAD(P)-dependent glycerol-3-phosphate dehydrogenase [Chloroflexi bacterium]|nr:NAD(P)-dependent glycerol-3-phosphate dehydrogenase [Chloroflexota bacterium]